MKRLNTHELVPGMVLEAPVRDQKGRLLIPAGETVNAKHVRICKIWGAMDIWVKTEEAQDRSAPENVEEIPEHLYMQAEVWARNAFQDNDPTEPFISKVFQLAVQRKAKLLYAQGQAALKTDPASNQDWSHPELGKGYYSSDFIYDKILKYEEENGMNGFILLSHIGATPKRPDKFYLRLDDLITELKQRGYQFELLDMAEF